MVYMLIIYSSEADWINKSEAEMAPMMREHDRLEQDLRTAGIYRGCGGLAPTSAATTVRIRGGKTFVTDGPFAETKEQLGGYYLVEGDDLGEVLKFAARIPGMGDRAIEVRPVVAFRA